MDRRVKTEALFRGMAAANEKTTGAAGAKAAAPKPAANFEQIMQDEAKKSKRQVEEEKRVEARRAATNTNMKFDWIGSEQKAYVKDTIATTAPIDVATPAASKGGKNRKRK